MGNLEPNNQSCARMNMYMQANLDRDADMLDGWKEEVPIRLAELGRGDRSSTTTNGSVAMAVTVAVAVSGGMTEDTKVGVQLAPQALGAGQ